MVHAWEKDIFKKLCLKNTEKKTVVNKLEYTLTKTC